MPFFTERSRDRKRPSCENAQSIAEGIPNRPALEIFFRKKRQRDSIFFLLPV